MKGGFQLIDFKSLDLTSGTATEIKGIYDQVARSNGKRTIIHSLIVGDVAYKDFTLYFKDNEGSFSASGSISGTNLTVSITSGDSATVTIGG